MFQSGLHTFLWNYSPHFHLLIVISLFIIIIAYIWSKHQKATHLYQLCGIVWTVVVLPGACVCVCVWICASLASISRAEPYWGFVNSWQTSRLCCSEVCPSVGTTWVHMRWCGTSRSTWEGQTTMKSQTLVHQFSFSFFLSFIYIYRCTAGVTTDGRS